MTGSRKTWLTLAALLLVLGVWFLGRGPDSPARPDAPGQPDSSVKPAPVLAQHREPPMIEERGADPEVVSAVKAARQRVIAAPDSAEAWGALGLLLFVHQYPSEAAACLEAARALDATNPRWPYFQALNIIQIDAAPRRAIAALRQAADLAGSEPTPQLRLGECLLELGETQEAAACFDAVLRADPQNAWALAGAGQADFAAGRMEDARRHLTAAIGQAPNVKGTRLLLAQVHFRLGDADAARHEQEAAGGLPDSHAWPDPWRAEAMKLRTGVSARIDEAKRLDREGRSEEAITLLEKVVAQRPDSYSAGVTLGRLQTAADYHLAAVESFKKAIELLPDAYESYYALGVVLHRLNRPGDAIPILRRAAELDPDYAPTHFVLAQCHILLNDRAAARAALLQTLRLQPDHALAHYALGDTLLGDGDYAGARAHLEQALRLNPNDAKARKRLDFLSRQERNKE